VDTSDYTGYRPLMFSIAYRITGSVSDAEDLVQEASPMAWCRRSGR
jgi:RNA polymerase sigma-70 factor, ECF subfamily